VLYLSLLPLISHLDVDKRTNIAKHKIWVLSELSVGRHKMLKGIGRTYISLL